MINELTGIFRVTLILLLLTGIDVNAAQSEHDAKIQECLHLAASRAKMACLAELPHSARPYIPDPWQSELAEADKRAREAKADAKAYAKAYAKARADKRAMEAKLAEFQARESVRLQRQRNRAQKQREIDAAHAARTVLIVQRKLAKTQYDMTRLCLQLNKADLLSIVIYGDFDEADDANETIHACESNLPWWPRAD